MAKRTPNTDGIIADLRERIKKLDHDQNRAMKFDAYLPTNNQASHDFEDRAQRLSELRRELLNLIRGQK